MPGPVEFRNAELTNFLRPEIFESIFEISSEAIWVRDIATDQNSWLASKENQQKFGIEDSVAPADFWMNNIHPDDKPLAIEGYTNALHNNTLSCFEHEYRFRGASGKYFHIHDKMKFLRRPAGEAYFVVGAWRDVTQERKKQLELEQVMDIMNKERERFKVISEISNAATWEIDLISRQVYWFAGTATLEDFNLTKERYSLIDWAAAIHDDDRSRVVHNFNSTLQVGGDKYFDTYRIQKADGSYACMIDHGTFLRDEDGKAFRAIGGWVDITREYEREQVLRNVLEHERKLNEELAIREEELTRTEEDLRLINEQLSSNIKTLADHEFILNQSQRLAKIGSWQLDVGTGHMFWSEEMYNVYGVKTAFNVIDHHEKFYSEKSCQNIENAFGKLNTLQEAIDLNVSFTTPAGFHKWVRIAAYPVLEDDILKKVIGISYDITFQKESEELLRVSEEKFSNAFNNNPDLMVITREDDLLIVEVNEKVQAVLGYEKKEVLGRISSEFKFFVNPEDRRNFFEAYARYGTAEIECPWWKKDGTIVQLLINSSRIEINGQSHFISVMKDISDRKSAEERFQKAFDLSPDLMLIFRERDLILIEANSKIVDFSGYRKNEVIGKRSADVFIWENDWEREMFINRYFENGSSSAEAFFYKKNKEKFFGMISTLRIVLNGENHLLTVVRDITEKRKYERKLIESEANLNATINNTGIMVWSVDSRYRVVTFNKPFYDYILQKYGREVKIGEEILSLKSEALGFKKSRWNERYDLVLKGNHIKDVENVDGLYLSYSFSPIKNNDKISGVSIFAEDVTERMHQEQELANAYKKIGELKLTALRSVMNPHFIFNALNSIQFFIAKNDRQNAINYLSTFSKLIRGILNSSVENKINLSDELELLKHYINLEILRFENKFRVVYNVDNALDLESIEVPSLLIQPFVENAIIHGLYNKKGKEDGRLTISIQQEDNDSILFKIEDNGIGRQAAEKLKEQNFPTHKSMGAMLTAERLKMLSEDGRAHYETIDLMEGTEATGTLVKIWIPM